MRQRILAGIVFCLCSASGQTASFTTIQGTLYSPSGNLYPFIATAVSNTGVVVGDASYNVNSASWATRWTSAGGFEVIGPNSNSRANAVSADGSVIVGDSSGRPARWTSSDGMVPITSTSYFFGAATGVSSDGQRMAAYGDTQVCDVNGHNCGLFTQPFVWSSSDGIVPLALEWRQTILTTGISGDGQVVIGYTQDTQGQIAGWRWNASEGIVYLGAVHLGIPGVPRYASADGSTIVGSYGLTGFRWTSEGITPLDMYPLGITADGHIVVGNIISCPTPAPDPCTFSGHIWTASEGLIPMADFLAARGVTVPAGWTIQGLDAISSDGQWLVGSGLDPSGQGARFIANVAPVPVPAVGWVLAPAFGALGWLRRRKPS